MRYYVPRNISKNIFWIILYCSAHHLHILFSIRYQCELHHVYEECVLFCGTYIVQGVWYESIKLVEPWNSIGILKECVFFVVKLRNVSSQFLMTNTGWLFQNLDYLHIFKNTHLIIYQGYWMDCEKELWAKILPVLWWIYLCVSKLDQLWGHGGRFKNAYELLNLRTLKFSYVNKIHIFQCMGKIFCVEFQRYPLKFHTKYLAHFKGTLWNSTQNILPIHWKIWF